MNHLLLLHEEMGDEYLSLSSDQDLLSVETVRQSEDVNDSELKHDNDGQADDKQLASAVEVVSTLKEAAERVANMDIQNSRQRFYKHSPTKSRQQSAGTTSSSMDSPVRIPRAHSVAGRLPSYAQPTIASLLRMSRSIDLLDGTSTSVPLPICPRCRPRSVSPVLRKSKYVHRFRRGRTAASSHSAIGPYKHLSASSTPSRFGVVSPQLNSPVKLPSHRRSVPDSLSAGNEADIGLMDSDSDIVPNCDNGLEAKVKSGDMARATNETLSSAFDKGMKTSPREKSTSRSSTLSEGNNITSHIETRAPAAASTKPPKLIKKHLFIETKPAESESTESKIVKQSKTDGDSEPKVTKQPKIGGDSESKVTKQSKAGGDSEVKVTKQSKAGGDNEAKVAKQSKAGGDNEAKVMKQPKAGGDSESKVTKQSKAGGDSEPKVPADMSDVRLSKQKMEKMEMDKDIKQKDGFKQTTPKQTTPNTKTNKENTETSSAKSAVTQGKDEVDKTSSVDEYRAKLAENRRLAREKAEREAAEQELRLKQLQQEEEERRHREEEEERLRELEELKAAEESHQAEQERLRKAMEEEEKRRKEEEERIEKERQQHLEAERLAQEAAVKLEEERQARIRKEEDEKLERKKKLESIMKRVKTGDSTPKSEVIQPAENNAASVALIADSGTQLFKSPRLQQLMAGKLSRADPQPADNNAHNGNCEQSAENVDDVGNMLHD